MKKAGEPVGIDLQSLSIPLITSTSSNVGFEADFTKVIREEFISHSKTPLVSEDNARFVLKGRVYDIETEPLTYDTEQEVIDGHPTTFSETSSRRLRIKLEMKLTDKKTGRVIWEEDAMEEKASFDVGTDTLEQRYSEQRALEEIARLMAKRIFLKTMERF